MIYFTYLTVESIFITSQQAPVYGTKVSGFRLTQLWRYPYLTLKDYFNQFPAPLKKHFLNRVLANCCHHVA